MLERPMHFVGGRWQTSTSAASIEVRNPATEQLLGVVANGQSADVDAAVSSARRAFDEGAWPSLSFAERSQRLEAFAAYLRDRVGEIAELITDQVGTPIELSRIAQAQLPIDCFDYYLELARTEAFEEVRSAAGASSLVVSEAVGVVAAITPWNFPFALAINKIAPALVAGCTVVLKPAPQSPLDALVLGDAALHAGLPDGVLNIVTGDARAGQRLVGHPDIDMVTFTGGTSAGRAVAAACAPFVRRCALELGGKSACVLLDDAPLEESIAMVTTSVTVNAGQTCGALTRLLVPRIRHAEVVDRLVEAFEAVKVGEPRDPATQMGPLISDAHRLWVEERIEAARSNGGRVMAGGRPQTKAGYFLRPTLITDVDNTAPIARDELFAPVLTLIGYDDVDEAVAIANDSPFGLAGAVWSADAERGMSVARRLRTGTVFLNTLPALNPSAPWGGYKQSGLGRECGPEGLSEFLEVKAIALPSAVGTEG